MLPINEIAAEQGLEPDDVIELLHDFLQYTETEDLVALRESFAHGDIRAVRHRAHSIKGAALNLQLLPMADYARRIEVACEQNTMSGVEGLIESVAEQIKALADELESLEAKAR